MEYNMNTEARAERKTAETDISLTLTLGSLENPAARPEIRMDLPFFAHMLTAMAFHGGFSLKLAASGDVDVDPHHLVEDVGLVLGEAFREIRKKSGPFKRFGHSVVPMDEALSEVTLDVSGRPYLVYRAEYPQDRAGDFSLSLIKEFLQALAVRGEMNIHASCLYGENGHHMAEALFKALGRALGQAFTPAEGQNVLSTKGSLDV